MRTVMAHNINPQHTYKMALNHLSDLTSAEFASLYLNDELSTSDQKNIVNEEINDPVLKDINWNAAGYVVGIKNTGQCGSGWAFGIVGATEFLYKSKTGRLTSLSEQQLMDCDNNDSGCNGGFISIGLSYLKSAGIATSDSYPYTAVKGTCKNFNPVLKFNNIGNALNCNDLYNALQQRTVGVMVDARNFQMYSSGVFQNCGQTVNHGVLLVGVSNNNYWYVKNEWGVQWGESGYIRIAIGNTCGICQNGAYPF